VELGALTRNQWPAFMERPLELDRRISLARSILAAALLLAGGPAFSQGNADTAKRETRELPTDIARWTGDWDAIVKRRVLRVLVVPGKPVFFLDKGRQRGTAPDAFREFEILVNRKLKSKALRFHVQFIPVARDQLIPKLTGGYGDLAVANLTVTPERAKVVDFSIPILTEVREIAVTGPASPAVANVDDLSGQEVFVRKSSSYYEHLDALDGRFRAEGRKPIRFRFASEYLEDEDLLQMLNAGLVPLVVVDSHKAQFWARIFKHIEPHPEIAVGTGGDIAWAMRKGSPLLKREIDDFVRKHRVGTSFGNIVLRRYFENVQWVKQATSGPSLRRFQQVVGLFRKYSDRYDMDYLLMMAQGFQESELRQDAVSPAGAIGIMQVMPATGRAMRVGDISQVGPNIHAGVKYMRFTIDTYYADQPMDPLDKGLFAFAAYNAGPSRVRELRAYAEKRGLDPNRWFNNVELIAAERIGQETVTYVSNIYKYYIAYRLVQEDEEESRKARDEMLEKK
jgi:membrane-bound lytic murein transglycosylase MltF